jgi:hypothetical protein
MNDRGSEWRRPVVGTGLLGLRDMSGGLNCNPRSQVFRIKLRFDEVGS